MDAQSTFLKVAYLQGLKKVAAERTSPEDQPLVKEAILASLIGSGATAMGGMLGRQALRPIWGAAKAIGRGVARGGKAVGRGAQTASSATATATPGALGAAGKEVGRFGKNLVGMGLGKRENMSHLFRGLTMGGRKLPADMLQYGAISGAIGGLSGEPGEGWSWSRAGKGLLGGAAGGLGWNVGGRAIRAGLGKALGATRGAKDLTGIAARAQRVAGLGKGKSMWAQRVYDKRTKPGFSQLWHQAKGGKNTGIARGLGETAKDMGLKFGLGVPAVAGALGANIGAEDLVSRATDRDTPHTAARAYQAMQRPQQPAYYGAYPSPYFGGGR